MVTIKRLIKNFLRRTFLLNIVRAYRQSKRAREVYQEWSRARKPIPAPHLVKQMIVKEYAKKFKPSVFVETGTYFGDMVHAVEDVFDEIYSIELGQELYDKAKERFAGKNHITLLQGDSAEILPRVLAWVNKPCLFWLDGHYSAGVTAKGAKNTPIREELKHIFGHSVKGHIILIDDARHFKGQGDYPSIQELHDLVTSLSTSWTFEARDDIIRIVEVT